MKGNLPGIAIACREAHEAVGEVVVVDEGAQLASLVRRATHGPVVVANNSLSDQGSEVILVVPAYTLDGEGDVRGRHAVVADANLRADEAGLGVGEAAKGDGVGGDGKFGEVLLGVLDELLVVDTTSADEDHTVSGVVGLDVRLKVVALNGQDVLLRTKDGATKGLTCRVSGSAQARR